MKENAIVIAGYYGFGNAGDELILRSLVDQFRSQEPQCQVIVFSDDPETTRRRFEVDAVDRWKFWDWVGPLRRARRFLLGGGGLLQEDTGPWNHAYYLALLLLAKLFGCRTEVRAIGVDPIQRWSNRFWTSLVLNSAADSISVRDADSQRSLEIAGVTRPILRTSDLVFHLTAPETRASDHRIALCLTPYSKRPGWEHDLGLLCARIVKTLKVEIDLVPFFPAQDLALSEKVAQLAGTGVHLRTWNEPESLLTWMGEYSLVIGMRYHALVLAALHERPFIGWGTQRKVRALCRDFGQSSWSFERGWDGEAVFRQLTETWRQRDILPQRYRARLPQLRSSAPILTDVPRIYPAQV
jgi:polysaccharide pyruvyl transferase CsaB